MTKAEKEWVDALCESGCIVCRTAHGIEGSPSEIHHLRSGTGMGKRSSWFDTLPLCPQHHRLGGYGVAFHAGRKAFEKRYGTELELLERVKGLV